MGLMGSFPYGCHATEAARSCFANRSGHAPEKGAAQSCRPTFRNTLDTAAGLPSRILPFRFPTSPIFRSKERNNEAISDGPRPRGGDGGPAHPGFGRHAVQRSLADPEPETGIAHQRDRADLWDADRLAALPGPAP